MDPRPKVSAPGNPNVAATEAEAALSLPETTMEVGAPMGNNLGTEDGYFLGFETLPRKEEGPKHELADLRGKFIKLQVELGDLIPPMEGERANDPIINRVQAFVAKAKEREQQMERLGMAVEHLVLAFLHGAQYEAQNPYARPYVEEGMKALQAARGLDPKTHNWMDVVLSERGLIYQGLPKGMHGSNKAAIERVLAGQGKAFAFISGPNTYGVFAEATVAEGDGLTDDGFLTIKNGFPTGLQAEAWMASLGLRFEKLSRSKPEGQKLVP